MRRYLLDTAIWIDLYEDRRGYNSEPLGEYAWNLLSKIRTNEDKIIVSDLIIIELQSRYSLDQITSILLPFEFCIERVRATKAELEEAESVAYERNIPRGDALHAITARNGGFVLITRDRHFEKLKDIAPYCRPEDII